MSFDDKTTVVEQHASTVVEQHTSSKSDIIDRYSTETINLKKEKDNPCCPICQEILIFEDMIRLLCFHSFHYECILKWYHVSLNKKEITRTCPLCRRYGGYLPRKYGDSEIFGIHYPEARTILGMENPVSYKSISKLKGTKQCQAVIKSKSSKNYGKQCPNVVYCSKVFYCGIHKSYQKIL